MSLKSVPKGSIDNNATSVQTMAWRQISDKQLPKPMLTRFIDSYMRHWGEMRWYFRVNHYENAMKSKHPIHIDGKIAALRKICHTTAVWKAFSIIVETDTHTGCQFCIFYIKWTVLYTLFTNLSTCSYFVNWKMRFTKFVIRTIHNHFRTNKIGK